MGLLAVTALTFVPSSAQAYVTINPARATGWCIDANSVGTVYLLGCTPGNIYQQWERWQGGWTRQRATGRCLQVDPYRSISTGPCDASNPLQFFQHWEQGWFQRVASSEGSAMCLRHEWTPYPGSNYIVANPCLWDDPIRPHEQNLWVTRAPR